MAALHHLIICCSARLAARSDAGRPWCRYCGGMYVCYPDCPTQA